MKKGIEFTDVLQNKVQFKTAIDIEKELKNEPYWTVARRKLLPEKTFWEQSSAFEDKYFVTEEDAWIALTEYIKNYIENSKKIGLKVEYDVVSLYN